MLSQHQSRISCIGSRVHVDRVVQPEGVDISSCNLCAICNRPHCKDSRFALLTLVISDIIHQQLQECSPISQADR